MLEKRTNDCAGAAVVEGGGVMAQPPVCRTTRAALCGGALLALSLACGLDAVAQQASQDLAPLVARAGVSGTAVASCRGEIRVGHPEDIAVAVSEGTAGGRYLALMDGTSYELSTYSGKADLSCYTVREADRLTAEIAKSDTLNGRITAEWDGTVVCAFIEPTIAVCWQYAPERKAFVRIGGWTT
ncbi:MAG: hypothetical protein ABL982_09575 [Vicinamibacterales bacterium]